jgi:hypothetical protein
MKAAWETGRIKTEEARTKAVDFASETGFDTIVTGSADATMLARAHDKGIQIIAVVTPSASRGDFAESHPQCVQKMRNFEHEIRESLAGSDWVHVHGESFHWQAPVLPRSMVCFEHDESMELVRKQIDTALEFADGVALDGFGFNNYYACFCETCDDLRAAEKAAHSDQSDVEVMATVSSRSLINVHRRLHDHAKSIRSDATVINHVWPMFLPDEHIGTQYKLDYCTQTISWFYPPEWRLERIQAEAAEIKRLENPETNRFVPFIGIVDMNDLVRTPERLSAEIEIGLKYGDGSICLSRLSTLQNHQGLGDAAREALG